MAVLLFSFFDSQEHHKRKTDRSATKLNLVVGLVKSAKVVKWKNRSSVTWDACSMLLGGAAGAGWDALLGMEAMDLKAGQKIERAITLVLVLAKAFERV